MGFWKDVEKVAKKVDQGFDAVTAYLEDSERNPQFESDMKGVLGEAKRKLHGLAGEAAELGAKGAHTVGANGFGDKLSSMAKEQQIKAEPNMVKKLMLQIKKIMDDLVKSIKNVCQKHGVESDQFAKHFEGVSRDVEKVSKVNKTETSKHRDAAKQAKIDAIKARQEQRR